MPQQQNITQLLQSNSKLAPIIQKAQNLNKLQKILHQELANMLAVSINDNNPAKEILSSIHLSDYQHGRLHISCDNAAVSTRLRYLIPELIQRLRNKDILPSLINIELNIVKHKMPEVIVAENAPKSSISAKSSKLLKDTLGWLRTSANPLRGHK